MSIASPSPDLSGRKLGDYQLLRRLGRGAMAEVYLAEQVSLRRQVAIKILKPELAGDESYVRRFHNEAMAAASLTHANIVQIHEVGEREGLHFIAQEYVPGRNVGELIQRSGPLDVKLAVNVMRQVAAALHRAAEQGIVHRDIKPENIMLAPSGEVKVADFGLARVQGGDGLNLTQVGVTMGTPLYMSPEQIEGRAIDARSDLYSFGVTCYHMLAGRPPFTGDTPLAVAVQHLNSQPPRLEDHRPDLPGGLCRIVHKLMSKKPDERYNSSRDLLQELRGIQVAGLEAGWSDGLGDWSTPELSAQSSARIEATQQLDALMKTTAELAPPRLRIGWLAAMAACGLLIGVATALVMRSDSILAGAARAAQSSQKRDTVWAQLYHAKQVDTEAAWQSVPENFPEVSPENVYAANLARQGLVRFYLTQSGEYGKALPLLDQLIASGDTELSFRAFGLAGKCVALHLLGRREEGRELSRQLTPELMDLVDPGMRQTLEDIVDSDRTAMSREAQQNLERLKSESADAE